MWKALSAVNYGDKTKLVQLESLTGWGLSRALNIFAYCGPLISQSIWMSKVWTKLFPVYVKYGQNVWSLAQIGSSKCCRMCSFLMLFVLLSFSRLLSWWWTLTTVTEDLNQNQKKKKKDGTARKAACIIRLTRIYNTLDQTQSCIAQLLSIRGARALDQR